MGFREAGSASPCPGLRKRRSSGSLEEFGSNKGIRKSKGDATDATSPASGDGDIGGMKAAATAVPEALRLPSPAPRILIA